MAQQSFEFHGDGSEYFKIWIVNLILTVLTLGIYGAWAKVRTNRYFYGNTVFQGHHFDYLATPWMLLKGRIIAIIFVVLYVLAEQYHPYLALSMAGVLLLATPWIIHRSLRFNAAMSQYRNVRFGFDGDLGGAFLAFIVWPLLGVVTAGLLMPMAQQKATAYLINYSRYGDLRFANATTVKEFYTVLVVVAVITLVIMGIVAGLLYGSYWLIMQNPGGERNSGLVWFQFVIPVAFMVTVYGLIPLFAGSYYLAGTKNITFNATTLDARHHFSADFRARDIMRLYFVYGIAMILTLGFAWPAFRVAMARYKADHTALAVDGELDNVVETVQEHSNALGDELGDAFDVGAGVI
jgi:uncharacterized membrane protein YjgN (DUF898 family)